jgi:general secretion pathway protein D
MSDVSKKIPGVYRVSEKLAKASRILWVGLACACFAYPALAESNKKVSVSFNNADAIDVIRWAADLTNKNIIVSDRLAKNKKITVIAGEPMTEQQAYEIFLAVMQVNDFVVVETDSALKIFPSAQAKDNAVPMIDDGGATAENFVISIIKIKNVSAQQLLALLRPLVPGTAQFQVHAGTNILLIADYKANVEKIARLVEQIDKAGTIDVEFIALKHASAKEVVELISSLVPRIIGAEGKDAPAQTLNFAADERSNSILMSGDTVLRSQMKKLIEKLDQPLQGEGNTQVIFLNYADATEMAEMLTGVSTSVAEGNIDNQAVSGGLNNEINIVASVANNALVITAPPSVLNTIKNVIEKLDIRREQVLVEGLLIEVNEDIGRKLSLLWSGDARNNGTTVGGSFIGANDPKPSADPSINGILSGLGLVARYFEDGNLQGVLQAIETVTESNVLSTPTIMVLDNEEAEILVGENVPFITGETSDLNSTNTRVSIQREDIGLHLKVKAKINLNDTITLEVEQKVESISPSKGDAADIITNKRELKTKAIVNDGQILVLGGLIRDESQETESKVPFLGDIPVIGWLFKGTNKSMVKKNLMILIHPKIIRDQTDAIKESIEAYNKMRALEQYYNENRDFLTIRPRDLPLLEELPDSMKPKSSSFVKEPSGELNSHEMIIEPALQNELSPVLPEVQ